MLPRTHYLTLQLNSKMTSPYSQPPLLSPLCPQPTFPHVISHVVHHALNPASTALHSVQPHYLTAPPLATPLDFLNVPLAPLRVHPHLTSVITVNTKVTLWINATSYVKILITRHVSAIITVSKGTKQVNAEFLHNILLTLVTLQSQTHIPQNDNYTLTGTHPPILLHTCPELPIYKIST